VAFSRGDDPTELISTVKRLAGLQEGLHSYLPSGAERRAWSFRSRADCKEVLKAASDALADWRLHPRFRAACRTVLDELMTNALFNAPTTAGKPRFAHLSRDAAVTLERDEVIEVALHYNGASLALRVTDSFGSITPTQVRQQFGAYADGETRSPRRASGGAGLGLSFVQDSVTQLLVELTPGRRTDMVGLLSVGGPYRDFARRGKSMHLFVS
jgi:signal transduction histidine kinase